MSETIPGFDPKQIQALFGLGERFAEAAWHFAAAGPENFDPQRLLELQRRNLESMATATQRASAAYEQLFREQMEVIRDATEQATRRCESLRADPAQATDAEAQSKLIRDSLEELAQRLTALTEAAAKANAEAFQAVGNQFAENAAAFARRDGDAEKA